MVEYQGIGASAKEIIILLIAVVALVLLLPYILKRVIGATLSETGNLVKETVDGAVRATSEAVRATSEAVRATSEAVVEQTQQTMNVVNPDYNVGGSYQPAPWWTNWNPIISAAKQIQIVENLKDEGLVLSDPKVFLPEAGATPSGYVMRNGIRYFVYGCDETGYNCTDFKEVALWDLSWIGMKDLGT